MQNYNVLDSTSPITGQIFIEASAGTGKTFAIEHMVLRLILQGIDITKILVVTFTKAGALDLKRRIHASLLDIADKIKNDDLSFAYLRDIDNKEEALLLIENACALSSEMPISTIHSFAFTMLSSFAFEGGVPFDLLDFEDDRQKDHTLISILDTLRAQSSEQIISAAQVTKMMDLFSRRLSSFTKKVTQIIENEKDLELPKTYEEINKAFKHCTENLDFELLYEELVKIAPDYKGTTNRQKEIHPKLIKSLKHICNQNLDSLILASPSLTELLQDDNIKKGKERSFSPLLSLTDKISPLVKEAKDPLTPLTHIALRAKKRLLEKNIQGPDAILASMCEAIKRPAFHSRVQELFSCCIIDEFQDTDPMQWHILSHLFFDSALLFCTVGDPKQSIYAFRGADLPTYLKAKERFKMRFSLTTNFRSHPRIIKSLNNLFAKEHCPDFLSFEKESKDLQYFHVEAGREAASDSNIELLLAEPEKKKTVRQSLDDAEQRFFFPDIVNKIKTLQTPFDQMAILVKDRYQGLAISIFLQKKSIPVKASISSSLLESNLFSLFETLLFLTFNPRSESLIKKLIAHPLIDASLDLLKEDLSNPILQRISIEFSGLKSLFEDKGIHVFLFALLETKLFKDTSLADILCTKESWYLTMIQIISLFLTNFEKDPRTFILQIKKLDPEVFTFLKKSCGTDKKSVTIITSHLSKGLEFECVFALSLYTRMKQTTKNEEQAILIDKEKMRLLYVTLTRAKYHLFIYGTLFGDQFPLEKGCGSPLELFLARFNKPFLSYSALYESAFNLSSEDFLTNFPIKSDLLLPQTATPLIREKARPIIFDAEEMPRYKKPEKVYSFSSLPFEQKEIEHVEAEPEFPYGAAVGNQIHLLLERVLEEGLYKPFSKEKIFPIMKSSFANSPLEGHEEIIFDKLKEVFTANLSTGFKLEDVACEDMWQEVLFHYNLDGSPSSIKGFADLIFQHKGKFYVLDWKTNHLEKYTQESIKEALHHHNYDKQASIYSRALKAFVEQKGLKFDEVYGGAFYMFIRGGKEGILHFAPGAMKDEEVLCLI